jgi:hypothetical protein
MPILFRVLSISAFVIASSAAVLGSSSVHAEQAAADTPAFSTGASMTENLKGLSGKRVTLYLVGGSMLTGTIKTVGDHFVQLEKLDGKDYFDALVAVDRINAIDTRVRTPGK